MKTSKINIQLIVYLREEDQLLKFRNKFVSKRIGTKTLASLLAFGMALCSPMAVFADDGETAVVAENTVQAKKTDGSEVFVSVSDYVRGMMERGAVRLNDETGYLEDTSTGQKVDPETGERLTETPAIPDNPGNEENPETPEKPETPETPENPEIPEAPEKPDTPENPETAGGRVPCRGPVKVSDSVRWIYPECRRKSGWDHRTSEACGDRRDQRSI